MPTIAIERTRNGVLRSAEQATLTVQNFLGTPVVPTTIVPPESEGVYRYQADFLTPGSYTAIWVFTNTGYNNDTIVRVFTLDSASAIPDGVTLMEIEQLMVRRSSPYIRVQAATGSTVNRLAATKLKSSLALGTYEDHFIVRRGITSVGGLIVNNSADDRSRLVSLYDAPNGWLNNDRAWQNAPDVNNSEMVEIQALDPEHEVRPAVLTGLKRCYFWDTVQIALTEQEAGYRLNLSNLIPWLQDPRLVKEVQFSYLNARGKPTRMPWWKCERMGRSLYLLTQEAYVGQATLHILRPAHTLVNEEPSLTGPNDDLDIVYVDASYAAWAGIIALWQDHPERMAPLTKEMLRADLKSAATEFTKDSIRVARGAPPEFTQLDYGRLDLGQIGNLAEPIS